MARFFKWFFGVLGGIIVFLTQTPPDEAISSLGKWASLMGVDKPPAWLSSQSADTVGLGIGIAFLIVCVLIWIYQRSKKSKAKENFGIYFENEDLEIYKIAYLSLGIEPMPNKELPKSVNARNSNLKTAIRKGYLKAELLKGKLDGYAIVNVKNFNSYAKDSGVEDFVNVAEKWNSYHSIEGETEYISITDVARRIYDKHNNPNDYYYLDFVDFLEGGGANRDILSHIAEAISCYVDIFGINVYGAELLKIDTSKIKFNGENRSHYFLHGKSIHRKKSNDQLLGMNAEWRNVCIRQSDVDKAIQSIREHAV